MCVHVSMCMCAHVGPFVLRVHATYIDGSGGSSLAAAATTANTTATATVAATARVPCISQGLGLIRVVE